MARAWAFERPTEPSYFLHFFGGKQTATWTLAVAEVEINYLCAMSYSMLIR
jgi:hypothetical protein